jgi:hypothetical protein
MLANQASSMPRTTAASSDQMMQVGAGRLWTSLGQNPGLQMAWRRLPAFRSDMGRRSVKSDYEPRGQNHIGKRCNRKTRGSALEISTGRWLANSGVDQKSPRPHRAGAFGVPTASGQKTTLSHYGIGPSQRAKAFAMEFPFNVEAILTVGIDVRVARRRQMHHITIIDVMVFRLELI